MLLFIDACPRGEGVSRTLTLPHAFFTALRTAQPGLTVTTHRLDGMDLPPLTGKALRRREALIDARAFDDALFSPARTFQRADSLVIAAPYWDLMFPAALKAYIEHVFIRELTFCYRDDQPLGLCRGRRALFLTTAGSPVGALDFGFSYLRATLSMLGVPRVDCVRAEGLDLQGADVPGLLRAARAQAAGFAAEW